MGKDADLTLESPADIECYQDRLLQHEQNLQALFSAAGWSCCREYLLFLASWHALLKGRLVYHEFWPRISGNYKCRLQQIALRLRAA